MFFAAAEALTAQVTDADLAAGRVFPAASRMREVAAAVAVAIAGVAWRQGRASVPLPADPRSAVESAMYEPRYA
jgi:malate dehydrogenase (oxaloacetate-decarboxylating)(NADP+)